MLGHKPPSKTIGLFVIANGDAMDGKELQRLYASTNSPESHLLCQFWLKGICDTVVTSWRSNSIRL